MKKGINYWSFKQGTTVKKAMEIAKDAGFDGIELSIDQEGIMGFGSNDLKEIKKMSNDIDIEIPSIASGLYWEYSLTSDSKTIREKSMMYAKRQIDYAVELGADTVLVIPGMVGADFIPNADVLDYSIVYERAINAIGELKIHAEKHKITVGLENVWNKFLLSPMEMRSFIEQIDSKYVASYLDIGNTLLTGYPEHWINILNKKIKKIHFKDYRKNPGGISSFVDLLEIGRASCRERV